MNGALYLIDWGFLKTHRARYGEYSYSYIMSDFYSVEIDSMTDLRYAEFLVECGEIDLSYWRGTRPPPEESANADA